jgi:hypothetical protein
MAGWRRFMTGTAGERRLVIEAALLLVLVRIGLRFLAFATLLRLVDRLARRRGEPARAPAGGSAGDLARQVAWAVTAVGRRLPGSMTCLSEALAAAVMLQRRGYAPQLRVGVQARGDGSKPLKAHAWLECEGHIVVGELENLAEYAVLSAPGCL